MKTCYIVDDDEHCASKRTACGGWKGLETKDRLQVTCPACLDWISEVSVADPLDRARRLLVAGMIAGGLGSEMPPEFVEALAGTKDEPPKVVVRVGRREGLQTAPFLVTLAIMEVRLEEE